jgi:beta-catenin-like protein 1
VTASGNLYHLLANPSIIQIFLALVQHENGDIAADTIQLLSELTEADAVESFVRVSLYR